MYMDFCNVIEEVEHIIEKIDDVFEGTKSTDYLIIIDADDKTNKTCLCNRSLYDIIDMNRKYISGNLHILEFSEYEKDNNNKIYRIGGEVIKRQLYKKLPKDLIYVTETEYIIRNYLSMYNEFIFILNLMNVKLIEITIIKEDKCSILCDNYHTDIKDELHKKMKIDSNEKYADKKYTAAKIIELLDKSKEKFYYYHIKEEWKNIITQRLNGQNIGKYRSELSENQTIGTQIQLPIDIGINAKCQNKIIYQYNIHYYPLEPPTIDKLNEWIVQDNAAPIIKKSSRCFFNWWK